MDNIIKKLVPKGTGNLSMLDLAGATASKYATERLMTPFVGNGTLFSGGVKIVASQVAKGIPVAGKYVGAGLLIDGTEDIIGGLLDGVLGKGNARSLMPSAGQNAQIVQVI